MIARFEKYTPEEFEKLGMKMYLTVREASAFFGLGVDRMIEMYNDRDLDLGQLKIGNRRYLHRERLTRFLESIDEY